MAENSYSGYALVYGGSGALGNGIVSHFKGNNWWVGCIDVWREFPIKSPEEQCCTSSTHLIMQKENEEERNANQNLNKEADMNILVHFEKGLKEQENEILGQLDGVLKGAKLDAIICAAGGYSEGNVEKVTENLELMWQQNVWPSVISASIAAKYLSVKGMVCFSGARSALDGTPTALAYGLAKASIHQLTKSLSCPNSGLPENSFSVALLPITLDTVVNRQNMPEGDISAWTPTKYISELLLKWSQNKDRPKNGSLVQFTTQNFNTDITYL